MIATAWRVVGVGFSLLVVLAAALLYGVDPQQTRYVGSDVGDLVIGFSVRTDDLTVFMLAIVGVIATCVQVYSISYLHERVASYTALVTLFTAAMVTVVVSDSLFLLLIGWEVMGACSYLLIGHYWERRDARAGAVKAFLMTRLGDVGFLFGIFVLAMDSKHRPHLRTEARPALLRRTHGRHPAAPGRRRRQVRAGPAADLAAGRDARPEPGQRADPRGHHGCHAASS